MAPEPCPLLSLAELSFDFQRGTIARDDGHTVGSLRWSRRPGARLACDLGYHDADGDVQWWVRPTRLWGWSPDVVLTPDRATVGDITPEGLRVDGRLLGTMEPQRYRFYLPEWQISGDAGFIAEVRLERRWMTGEVRRRELWHVRLSSDVQPPIRYLAAAAPYVCWRWYHSAP